MRVGRQRGSGARGDPAQRMSPAPGDRSKRLQGDFADAGRPFEIRGHAHRSYRGRPLALRRCLTNLIDSPAHEERLKELRRSLEQWMVRTDDPMLDVFRRRDDPTAPERRAPRNGGRHQREVRRLEGEITRVEEVGYAYRRFRGPDGRVYSLNEQK